MTAFVQIKELKFADYYFLNEEIVMFLEVFWENKRRKVGIKLAYVCKKSPYIN
ncbi:hypothetical protein ACOI1C_14020 [Bacillus sp. DJP31]|uniref:hypothetical protein n=1 Tax=Bacillus sp. DJP31 TaxID=3409789 RepID=UPI003BB5A962